MANKPLRVVVDTNIFISFLISNSFSKFDKYLKEDKIQLLFSDELLNEFLSVIKRPKLKKYFADKDVKLLLEGVQHHAQFIEVKSSLNICRDEKDNFLLALCVDGKANYLLTGDDDLLVLKKVKQTRIIKMADFFKL